MNIGKPEDALLYRPFNQWQPIETAPKDGTDIIVMYVNIETQIVHAAFWIDAEESCLDPEDTGWWTYVWTEVGRSKMEGICSPTHWMPLPEPPKGEGL